MSSAPSPPRRPVALSPRPSLDGIAALGIGLAIFGIYVLTLAPTVLRSDSGEFHVMPWVLGVAHAPGYPFLTLVGRLVMFLPIGDPAYRVNLLDAAAAAAAVAFVYLAVVELSGRRATDPALPGWPERVGGLAAAAVLGLGATYWQQSLVGGPRPFIFFFTALLFWLLFRWGNRRRGRDLALLAGVAGLALTHHLNQLLLFPALALYVLARDPRLLVRFRQLGLALAAFLLPLLLYLYLPLRSAMDPPLGATNLADPRELLSYLTASNYQDAVLNNCGGSRAVQAQRYLVLLSLQFGAWLPLAGAAGSLLTLTRAPAAGLALLYAFVSNSVFGICSSLAMPEYVIPSFVVGAIWIGLALAWPLAWLGRGPAKLLRSAPAALAAGLILGLSAYRLVTALPYQNMGDRTTDAERALSGMAQTQPGGLVLSDWESITPIWYAQHVIGLNRSTKTALVTAAPAAEAWLIETQKGLTGRPVALPARIQALGEQYKLFPVGSLFEVTEKPLLERSRVVGVPNEGRALRLLGTRLSQPTTTPGALVRLTLYHKSTAERHVSYQPVLRLGSQPAVVYVFDDALRYRSSDWADDEVVGEVYEFSIPAWAPPGALPLELAYRADGQAELVGLLGADAEHWTPIGSLLVEPSSQPILGPPAGALANFSNQLVLRGGRIREPAPTDLAGEPIAVPLRPGNVLEVDLRWSALRWLDESYTIFVQLLDSQNRLVAQQDALPLGGVYHTYKWVPGQVITDWYRLPVPPDLPPGDYWLEIGAYHSMTSQRLQLIDAAGGASRASLRRGPIKVE